MALTTSPSLLLRIRDPADEESWEQFLAIYSSIVRDYCFQRRLQPCDADDVVQEVMSRVCMAIRSFEYDPAKGRFRSWLGTIAANQIKTFLSKRGRNSFNSQDATPTSQTNGSGDRSGIGKEETSYFDPDSEWVAIFSEKIFRTACSRIRPTVSELAWECFHATWVCDREAAEVAHQQEITLNAVYVHKYKVLKRLEMEIKQLAEDVPVPRQSPGRKNIHSV